MKKAKLQLWCSMSKDRGQKSRVCIVTYELAPALSGRLYKILSATDKSTGEEYEMDGPSGVLSLNGNLDEAIAAADPKQVAFAKKELGVDLKNAPKKKPARKILLVDDEDDMPPLFSTRKP